MNKQDFAVKAKHMSVAHKELEEAYHRVGATREEAEHRAQMAEKKAALLEEILPLQFVKEFKASRDFSITAKRLLSDKIIKLF